MCKLILASGSSRRHLLLKRLNLKYRICVSNIDESVKQDEDSKEYVCRVARSKALEVYTSLSEGQNVLAADTIISLSGKVIGKPRDEQHAQDILQTLSAAEHNVFTAMCLKTESDEHNVIVKTKVKFKMLTNSEIYNYCLTNEPYDKAGAYAIQGMGSSFIEYISGSYTNVMGLPLLELSELLKRENLYN